MDTFNTLHIVSKSPYQSNALDRCLQAATENDGILLSEDGVYGWQSLLERTASESLKIYFLAADATARNVVTNDRGITYDDFVGLCARYRKTVSWF